MWSQRIMFFVIFVMATALVNVGEGYPVEGESRNESIAAHHSSNEQVLKDEDINQDAEKAEGIESRFVKELMQDYILPLAEKFPGDGTIEENSEGITNTIETEMEPKDDQICVLTSINDGTEDSIKVLENPQDVTETSPPPTTPVQFLINAASERESEAQTMVKNINSSQDILSFEGSPDIYSNEGHGQEEVVQMIEDKENSESNQRLMQNSVENKDHDLEITTTGSSLLLDILLSMSNPDPTLIKKIRRNRVAPVPELIQFPYINLWTPESFGASLNQLNQLAKAYDPPYQFVPGPVMNVVLRSHFNYQPSSKPELAEDLSSMEFNITASNANHIEAEKTKGYFTD